MMRDDETQPGLADRGPARFTHGMVILLACWFIGTLGFVVLSRIAYPFDLEWMEGGSLVQMLRLLAGKPLYTAPSLQYIPYIYPPFYYYLSAAAAAIFQIEGFFPLRLVSAAASLGIALLVYLSALEAHGSKYWALAGVGFFAATFKIGGAWFDIARVDMLFVFLLIAGTYALGKRGTLWNSIAGLLFACAFMTKQTALPLALGMLIFQFFLDKKHPVIGLVVMLSVSAVWVWMENQASSGWFWYYVFTLPGHHSLPEPGWIYLGWPVLMVAPVFLAAGAGFISFFLPDRKDFLRANRHWFVLGLGMSVLSILAGLNPGSFSNNAIPFYSVAALLVGVNMPGLAAFAVKKFPRSGEFLVHVFFVAQFGLLLYIPSAQIPGPDDLAAGWSLVERIRSTDGDVFVPNHNALPVLAGKPSFAHLIALEEIHGNFGKPDSPVWARLADELTDAFDTRRFAAIVLDQQNSIYPDIPSEYRAEAILYPDANTFYPVTGGRTRPAIFYSLPR